MGSQGRFRESHGLFRGFKVHFRESWVVSGGLRGVSRILRGVSEVPMWFKVG